MLLKDCELNEDKTGVIANWWRFEYQIHYTVEKTEFLFSNWEFYELYPANVEADLAND
jgi:hypothetical protein